MRAAEILVAMLLNEALPKVIAVVYGPDLPKEGYCVTGPNKDAALKTLMTELKVPRVRGATEEDAWSYVLLRGYSVLWRREDGSIALFGPNVQVNDEIVRIFGLQSGMRLEQFTRRPAGGLDSHITTGASGLGVT